MAEDKTYNGWTNRETWNAHLWLTNEEIFYRAAARLVQNRRTRDGQMVAIKLYCRDIWPSGRTPDGDSLSKVNWREIAASLAEK